MRLVTLLSLVLALAACDSSPLVGGDTPFVYATSGTDMAVDLVQTPSGDLVVVGSTEGRPRPADGTLALPSVLRFGLDGELVAAEVYRDIDYGDVEAVAWSRDGLVVSVSSGPDGDGERTVGVFRADDSGKRRSALLTLRDGYMLRGALVPASDGGVTAALWAPTATAPQLYRLRASGEVAWSVRLDGAQDVRSVAQAPGGDVYVQGPGPAGWIVARLDGETGQERWRRVRTANSVADLVTTSNGFALLEEVAAEKGETVRVVWLGSDGRELGTRTVAQSEDVDALRVTGAALAALPSGGIAVGVTQWNGWETPPEAHVVLLASDGSERGRQRFGVEGRWVMLSTIEPLADGRIAVAGAVGPERVSGYGGDDFDIRVSLYDIR